ncbi:MAG TPA: amidohydrolase family protein [Acidimicrobiales bacterium]|jgi:predicted TIM-barrel fold metal-dependent hydrolase
MENIVSADSHMLVLDEHVLKYLPAELQESYLKVPGPHRRAGLTPADPGRGPTGEWDPVARLADMDLDGIHTEVLYIDPTGGSMLYGFAPEEGREIVGAVNSAALDFARADPRRLVVVHLLPLHGIKESPEGAIEEVHRLAAEGARAVQVPLYPEDQGLPKYWDPIYDPVWSAVEEAEMPVSLHVCPPKGRGLGSDPTPARGVMQVIPPILMSQPMTELILSGVFERHPRLRVVLVESGLSWIPYLLERLDTCYHKGDWKDRGMPAGLPTDYWYRNMAATFEEDLTAMGMRDTLGIQNLLWASDYPHPDQTFPNSMKVIAEHFSDMPPDERDLMIRGNASRLYRL